LRTITPADPYSMEFYGFRMISYRFPVKTESYSNVLYNNR